MDDLVAIYMAEVKQEGYDMDIHWRLSRITLAERCKSAENGCYMLQIWLEFDKDIVSPMKRLILDTYVFHHEADLLLVAYSLHMMYCTTGPKRKCDAKNLLSLNWRCENIT